MSEETPQLDSDALWAIIQKHTARLDRQGEKINQTLGHLRDRAAVELPDLSQLAAPMTADEWRWAVEQIKLLWCAHGDAEQQFPVATRSGFRLGKPYLSAYTSGATITLDPCDSAGTDNGQDNVTVEANWTLPANTNIPTTAIIPFKIAADGKFYALGQMREVITSIQYDTTSHKLQKKVRGDFGWFSTTESSSWVDITTAVDCTA